MCTLQVVYTCYQPSNQNFLRGPMWYQSDKNRATTPHHVVRSDYGPLTVVWFGSLGMCGRASLLVMLVFMLFFDRVERPQCPFVTALAFCPGCVGSILG